MTQCASKSMEHDDICNEYISCFNSLKKQCAENENLLKKAKKRWALENATGLKTLRHRKRELENLINDSKHFLYSRVEPIPLYDHILEDSASYPQQTNKKLKMEHITYNNASIPRKCVLCHNHDYCSGMLGACKITHIDYGCFIASLKIGDQVDVLPKATHKSCMEYEKKANKNASKSNNEVWLLGTVLKRYEDQSSDKYSKLLRFVKV